MKGSELAKWRAEYGWSQDRLARELGVNRQTVINWERADEVTRMVELAIGALTGALIVLKASQPEPVGRRRKVRADSQ